MAGLVCSAHEKIIIVCRPLLHGPWAVFEAGGKAPTFCFLCTLYPTSRTFNICTHHLTPASSPTHPQTVLRPLDLARKLGPRKENLIAGKVGEGFGFWKGKPFQNPEIELNATNLVPWRYNCCGIESSKVLKNTKCFTARSCSKVRGASLQKSLSQGRKALSQPQFALPPRAGAVGLQKVSSRLLELRRQSLPLVLLFTLPLLLLCTTMIEVVASL